MNCKHTRTGNRQMCSFISRKLIQLFCYKHCVLSLGSSTAENESSYPRMVNCTERYYYNKIMIVRELFVFDFFMLGFLRQQNHKVRSFQLEAKQINTTHPHTLLRCNPIIDFYFPFPVGNHFVPHFPKFAVRT